MAQVVISSPPKLQARVPLTPAPKMSTPGSQKVESQINSNGSKAIGEEAIQKAMSKLTDMFKGRDINVSTVVDITKGTSIVQIQDGKTGKILTSMPPDAAIQIADRAKEKTLGLLLDKLA